MPGIWRTSSLYLCLALGSCAAQSQFSGLITGNIFDPPVGSVRMLFGYPGAARITGSLDSGLDDAAISPDGQSAVALQGSRIVGLRSLSSASVQVIDFGSPSSQLRAAWSADSRTAAVWLANSDNTASLQFWTARQNPQSPVPAGLSYAGLQCIVLLPDGSAVLICVKDGDNSGIYRVGNDGSSQRLVQSADPAAIALDPTSRSFYYFDRAAASILQQAMGAVDAAQPVITTGLDTLIAPCGLAVLKNGNLAVADVATGPRSPCMT